MSFFIKKAREHEKVLTPPAPDLLFVYGTLLQGFENARFLGSPRRAKFLCRGSLAGKLYDTGPYPAYVSPRADSGEAPMSVVGEIFKIEDPDVLFETLDLIEGYNHQYPDRSLFVRDRRAACTDEGALDVWVYVYNQPIEGLRCIESGDYRAYCSAGATVLT